MQKLSMDIKCKLNPNYKNYSNFPTMPKGTVFREKPRRELSFAGNCADVYINERPVATKSASGLSAIVNKVSNYLKNYKKNIVHTYDHKVVFAMVEKELFGRNSIDSVTHDLDKMILYLFGAPKSFVSKYHRNHSMHHTESGKRMNLRSMLCDNIASSPEFKPEKKRSLREHFMKSKELQNVPGLREILEQFNYGEALDFDKIKYMKTKKSTGLKGLGHASLRSFILMFKH